MVLQANCPKIKYLEHALITLTLEAPNRGQLEIAIKSPKGNAFLEFRILSKYISKAELLQVDIFFLIHLFA